MQNDGSIVCSGSYSDKPIFNYPNHDGCIFKVNSVGDSLWQRSFSNYDSGVEEYLHDIKKTPDGGYVLCGAPHYAPNSQSWVVKTDSLGIAPGMVTVGINELRIKSEEVKIYPNPTKSKIFIEQNKAEKITITNALGQTVYLLNNPSSKQEIDLSSYVSGIYYVKIQGSSEQRVFKIIKKD